MAGFPHLNALKTILRWRHLPAQAGVLLTFALFPMWYRVTIYEPPPFGLPADFYLSRFLLLYPMLFTILAWLLAVLPGFGTLRRNNTRALWAFFLLCLALWAYASTAWALMGGRFPELAASAAAGLGTSILFAIAAASVGPSPRSVMAVLIVGLAVNAVITIGQAANQSALGLIWLDEFPFGPGSSAPVVQAGDWRWLRPWGLMPHPNMLAGGLLFGVFMAGSALLSSRRWVRWGALIVLLPGVLALLLTFSRAAWIGAAGGTFAVLPLLRLYPLKGRWRVLTAAAIGLIIVTVGFGVTFRPLLGARVGEGSENTELRSVSDRIVYTDFALRSIDERPLLGVGIANFPWRAQYFINDTFYDLSGDNVHHVVLLASSEVGLIGAGLWLAAQIAGLEAILRARASFMNDPARLGLLAWAFALILIGLFDHYPWSTLQFQVAGFAALGLASRPETPPNARA